MLNALKIEEASSINYYKLLVADIDGTLLGKNGIISAADKEALARVGDSGVRVSLSTGRVIQSALGIIHQLSLDGYHMFFDGALVSDPQNGKNIYTKPISKEIVRQIVEFVHGKEINLDLYSTTRYFVERETWATAVRRSFFKSQPKIVDFANLWQQETIFKGTLVVRSPEEKAEAEGFRRHFKNSLNFTLTKTPAYPEVDFINLIAPEVSKGRALEVLASHLEIPLSKIMAIGDGDNDVPLLSKAGLAIAMENAPAELKAVADYVTVDVEHSGVAAAIDRFLR